MIRRLVEQDRDALVVLLEHAPQMNLYLLGNIEANGFESDFCEFIGDVVDGQVRGVINRYMTGWTVYGLANADWAGLGAMVDAHPVTADRLQDNPGGIASLLPYLTRYAVASLTEEQVMELPDDRTQYGGLRPCAAPVGFTVRKASLGDLELLVDLYGDAADMTRTPAGVERPLRDRRVWLAERDGMAVAAALTNAETAKLAMIGGVYTRPAWRGLGLSQAICSALCTELIQTGRQPVLYWQHPAAGHVYTKLGFRPVGTWRSVRLETK